VIDKGRIGGSIALCYYCTVNSYQLVAAGYRSSIISSFGRSSFLCIALLFLLQIAIPNTSVFYDSNE
jgi:hypothetical protein